mmetsp:Transcript_19189/g.44791  ORF Transcript_19189/g.44791 Transcript_19189/m.44791 type:complete len:238 (-) Transcript_19189:575-1288(-)
MTLQSLFAVGLVLLCRIPPAALFHHDWTSFPPQDEQLFQTVMDERRRRLHPQSKPLFPDATLPGSTTTTTVQQQQQATATSFQQSPPPPQSSSSGGGGNSHCETLDILLTHEDTKRGITSDFGDDFSAIEFGTLQGGKVAMRHPDVAVVDNVMGEYTVLTTFLGPVAMDRGSSFQVDCYGVGSYQFGSSSANQDENHHGSRGGDQITFVAPCSGLPFFTITGGQGKYVGAQGFVEYR